MIWFTSDTHLGHKNIIKHSNRPFIDTIEMDYTIIDNINYRVQPDDTLYHLGDWSWHDIKGYRKQIKCKNIILVLGNHDKEIRRNPDFYIGSCFKDIVELMEVKLPQGHEVTLCHYAMKVWNKSHHGTWHLYGHSHGSLPDDPASRSFDVGVDCHGYKPLSFEDVKGIMEKKNFVPIDHHGSKSKVTRY